MAQTETAEHFQEKWKPVFRTKMRQTQETSAPSVSIENEGALDHSAAASEPRPASAPLSWLVAVLKAAAPWAVIIVVWEWAAAAGWSGAVLFPPPSSFLRYAVESDFRVGFGGDAMTIPGAIVASALRVLVGLAIGFVAAVVTGILISTSKLVSDMALPVVRGLAPIAPIAWIPLGIVLFGIGNPTAVFVVFMGVYFILTISTVAAVKAVDERLIKTARSHGASKAQIWTRVVFPAVLPQVFTMLRINFFAAWMAVLAAEMVGLKNGLGMMIILGREMFNTKLILLGMCMVGATGYLVDALLVQIQRKILWWQPVP
jgi:NitT/TauT family transport system permease protein